MLERSDAVNVTKLMKMSQNTQRLWIWNLRIMRGLKLFQKTYLILERQKCSVDQQSLYHGDIGGLNGECDVMNICGIMSIDSYVPHRLSIKVKNGHNIILVWDFDVENTPVETPFYC